MGDASAVPEHLYKYSDRCTHEAEVAQHAVRGLGPAITAFLQGAADQVSGVNVDVSAAVSWINGGRYAHGSIDQELAHQIAAAYYTDRKVRTVGLAFQVAGGSGALDKPLAKPVRTTDAAVAKELAEYQAGVAAAAKLPRPLTGDAADADGLPLSYADQPIFELLAKHANDPEFCRGLLEAGGSEAVYRLLGSIADDQFLFNYRTGGSDDPGKVVVTILRNAMADPNLAATLAPSLPKVMAQTLNDVPQNWRLAKAWKALLPVYTGIVESVHDPDTVLRILNALPLSKSLPAEDLKELREPLHEFLVTCAAHMLKPLPADSSSRSITKWANTAGGNLSWLLRYVTWMAGIDKAAEETAEGHRGAMTTFGLEVVAGIVLVLAPEVGVPGEIVLHSLGGVAVYELEPSLTKMLAGGEAEKLDGALAKLVEEKIPDYKRAHNGEDMPEYTMLAEQLRYQARAIAMIQVFNSGRVVSADTGKPVTLRQALDGHGISALAGKLDDPDWGEKYAIDSKNGRDLKSVLDGVDDPFQTAEKYGPH